MRDRKNQSFENIHHEGVPEDLVPLLLLALTGSTHVDPTDPRGLLVCEPRRGVCGCVSPVSFRPISGIGGGKQL